MLCVVCKDKRISLQKFDNTKDRAIPRDNNTHKHVSQKNDNDWKRN